MAEAKDYYARFVAERRDDPAVRADFARSLDRLARISADLKDPPEAIRLHLEALAAFKTLSETEGIIPALESAHAVAHAIKIAPEMSGNEIMIVNLSGRGDKDVQSVDQNV